MREQEEDAGQVFYLLVPKGLAQRARQCLGECHVKGRPFITRDQRLGIPFRSTNHDHITAMLSNALKVVPEIIECEAGVSR